jgi:hypothetical protein
MVNQEWQPRTLSAFLGPYRHLSVFAGEGGASLLDRLLTLLTAMLADPESYVYLAAVQGLATLR